MIADKIQRGVILFPARGAEDLVAQLVGFGIERHDDMVDALTLAVLAYGREQRRSGTATFVPAQKVFGANSPFNRRLPHNHRDYWNVRLSDFNEATSRDWS